MSILSFVEVIEITFNFFVALITYLKNKKQNKVKIQEKTPEHSGSTKKKNAENVQENFF